MQRKINKRHKTLSSILSRILAITLTSSLVSGAITVNAESLGFTPSRAVLDHLNQDNWSILQSILQNIYGSVTSPLKISDLDKGSYTTGQLIGNGDIGAIAAGVSTTSQQFYFGKNDFWGTLHAQGSSVKDNQGVLSCGGLDIWPTTAAGSQASSAFNMKQDVLNAQINTTMQLKDNAGEDATIKMNSWTADTDNVFVTEITNTGSNEITLNTKLWTPAMAYANASATDLTDAQNTYPYTGGIDTTGTNPVLWTTRDSNAGDNGNTSNFRSRIATATTVVGAQLVNTKEKVEANDYFDSNKGKYYNSLGEAGDFTISPGATANVVTYFVSSSGTYNAIKSVTGVQQDAVKGILDYTTQEAVNQLKNDHLNWWKNYWLKSFVQFNDSDLNKYYCGSLYIQGSANRAASSDSKYSKVNSQNLPGSMYGPWVPADNVGWGGRYFLNYNQQAQYYAAGSTNRIDTAIPYNSVIAYDLPWQINNAAAQGFDGAAHVRTLSPFHVMASAQPSLNDKASKKTYAFNSGSTDQKSNGMFAVIPMVFYYEYTLDNNYLQTVLYPYLKQLLLFYSDYVLKTDDGNGQYHYSVIGSSIHEGDAADINPDLDMGAIKLLSNFLVMHASEMGENQANIDRWKDLSDHTYFPEAMLPQGMFSANNNSNFVPTLIATDYQSPNQAHVDMIEPGDQPVELEGVVFPFENVQMLDGDKELLQKVINTLAYMNAWSASGFAGWSSQNNGFCKVYPIAARAGWPAADLLSKFKTALNAKVRNSNLTYYASGGAVETIGAMEGLNSMLMQSSTTPSMPSTIWAFPNWDMTKSVTYEKLGAMGNVEVSSAYDAASKTVQYVDLYSKRDGKIALVNPWSVGKPVIQVVNSDNTLGNSVSYSINGGKILFDAQKGVRYMVMNDTSDTTAHISGITLDKYSSAIIYKGTNGSDTTTIKATLAGNLNDTIVWKSSDESIATVTGSGNTAVIKSVGTGANKVANVNISAASLQDPGITQTCNVKVADVSTVPTSLIMINPKSATIYGPSSTDASTDKVTSTNRLQLTTSMLPSNAYDNRIQWTSSDQNVAMVDKNGLVIARGQGTVTITGKSIANSNLAVQCTVTVTGSGTDYSTDANLSAVLTAAKSISAYINDKTSGGGFTKVSSSSNWEGMQEGFQKAFINALGVKAKYSGYSTFNISKDTAYFAAIALNESIRSIDPNKALVISSVDKTALVLAINSALLLTSSSFDTQEAWNNLKNALASAQAVNNDTNAAQEEVDIALANLQTAMSKISAIQAQTISIAQVGNGTSSYKPYPSGYIMYQSGAVGLDLNKSASILPAPTNTTTLVATVNPANSTDKRVVWTAKDIAGSDVVTLGTPQTGSDAKLTMYISTSSGEGTKVQQFDSTIKIAANNAGIALVTATNTASGASANYIVSVSDKTTIYTEAEPGSSNPNATYIGGAGPNKSVSGSTSSGGVLAASMNTTKGLQISKVDGGASGGDYNVVVYYATPTARNGSNQRSLAITVNGKTYKFSCQGISYNYDFPEIVPVMVTVPLNAGDNTIQFNGDNSLFNNANAPNLDKIGAAPVSDYTAMAANVTNVTSASTSVTAALAAGSSTNLNKYRNNVTYQVYRDGTPVGNAVPVDEVAFSSTTLGTTFEYDKGNENIIPAGLGLVLRNYAATINRSDYKDGGHYTVVFNAMNSEGVKISSTPASLFDINVVLDKITLSADNTVLKSEKNVNLAVRGVMSDNSEADLTKAQILYSSDNTSAAIVDEKGIITGISEGIANITAAVTLNGVTKTEAIRIIVDDTAPITVFSTNSLQNNSWYNSDVKVILNASDNLSDVSCIKYRIGDSGEWISYTSEFNITREGINLLEYYSIDKAGNAEAAKKETIRIDKSLPSFSLTVNNRLINDGEAFDDNNKLCFNALDSVSGLGSAKIIIDNTTYTIDPKLQSSIDIDLSGKTGSYTAEITVIDLAGNILSNEFTINVTTSLNSINSLMYRYIDMGKLGGPLAKQLINNIDQAQHQMDIGNKEQAVKHLMDFIKHLNNKPLSDNIDETAKSVLNADSQTLINLWSAKVQ